MNGMGRPEQINLFKSLQPDLAILPELKEKNINALKPNEAVQITNNNETKKFIINGGVIEMQKNKIILLAN